MMTLCSGQPLCKACVSLFGSTRLYKEPAKAIWIAAIVISAAGTALGQAELPTAAIRFEQNATDGDVEVVIVASGRSEGLAKLTVVGPDGRTVIDFTAPDSSTLGIRQFEFESPEPTDVEGLKKAYPEGKYVFSAITVSGAQLAGKSTLSHQLPATASLKSPEEEGEDVPCENLEITWHTVPGLTATIIEIEQDELDMKLTVRLRGDVTSFQVPAGLLVPGTQYDLAIGTVIENGNRSFVETSFTTADE